LNPPLKNNLTVLQLLALRARRGEIDYKIASVTVVIQKICASRENSQAVEDYGSESFVRFAVRSNFVSQAASKI